MASSQGSTSGLEDGQHDVSDDLVLPDAPLPTVEAEEDSAREADDSDDDGLSVLNEPLPPPPANSSDDDLYEPDSSDEDAEIKDQVLKSEEVAGHIDLERTPSPWAPAKRRFDETGHDRRPFKRAKGAAFSHGYLTILNTDIEDAVAHYVPHDHQDLTGSQIGLTNWTSVEKELFFEALARLGQDDIRGISRRVRTKGELEVQQFIKLLHNATATQKRDRKLVATHPVDVPAAIEIGPQCSAALEEAGDAIALRQETYEESLEKKVWGDNWLITPFNYRRMEADRPGDMPSLQLFRASSWLQLSEQVFMNANFPENNWQFVSDDNPSIRATALEDFYSLAVSVTKRLVAATIYVAQSRIRAKKDLHFKSGSKNVVWPKDVEAAALSIGLKNNSYQFWAECARRLRLDVYDDEDDHDDYDDDNAAAESGANSQAEMEPMAYEDVEAALGGMNARGLPGQLQDDSDDHEEFMELSDTPSLDELSDVEAEPARTQPQSYEPTSAQPYEEEGELEVYHDEEAVRLDTKELLIYTAQANLPNRHTVRAAESRIRNELQHEAYADALDAKATEREERRLWEMLGRDPPDEVIRIKVPEKAPRRMTARVEDMYPSTGDWRKGLKYVPEWERALEDRKERN
jgi:hypothetical protein